ncbi:MAG: GyrI-like domain-containing protein [Cellulophaga sp.]
MKNTTISPFSIVGISIRTTNENGQAATDIGALWNKFMSEGLVDEISNKIDHTIYAVYLDYEGDHTKPYTTLLGCKVKNTDIIPEEMIAKTFEGGNYTKFISKGDVTKGHVYQQWQKIWEMNLPRAFTADFEVYGEKAQDPTNAEVEIFIATTL